MARRLVLTDADFLIFEAIDRHGPLPSHYLYEFTKQVRRDRSHLQNRLTEFYNGDAGRPYLSRPPQQFAGYQARYQHVVYDLTPRTKAALAERGTLSRFSPKRSDPFLHQLMTACVAASLELAAGRSGLRYIGREEILLSAKCPAATRQAPNPLSIPLSARGKHGALVPDDLFGLEYPGQGYRFFAVEIDRNTESIERKNLDQTAFGRKISGYLEAMRSHAYRAWWGIPNLHVLTVTTNVTHARNIIDHLRGQDAGPFADRFGFASELCFGANWRVPRELLGHLLEIPWATTGAPKDIYRA